MTTRKALLIGVETCKAGNLRGPGYDVALMRALVCDRFGFAVETVPDHLATRKGILDAFDRLVDDASAGDSLLFYFAGHGTRIEGSGRDEEEIHEAICPQDFERDDLSKAILDVELHSLFAMAQARGARLTAIFDCCFAGGLPLHDVVRRMISAGREILGDVGDAIGDLMETSRVRCIPGAGDVLEPLRGALAKPSDSRRLFRISEVPAMRSGGPTTVIFGACLAGELAREQRYGDEFHGVFTHHLTDVVRASDREITNVAVRDAVREAVIAEAESLGMEDVQRAIVAPGGAEGEGFLR